MPTTNPVPSTDPSDLLFNAVKLDEVVNGAFASYTDRLGVSRRTLSGIDAEATSRMDAIDAAAVTQRTNIQNSADVVLGGIGYVPPVAYAAGISLTMQTQTVSYNGNAYAPKIASLPFTTSGAFETEKFRLIQGLAAVDVAAPGGSSLIGYKESETDAVPTSVEERLRHTLSINGFGAVGDGGLTDNTEAINKAAIEAKRRNMRYLTALPGEYYCAGELIELEDVLIIGARAKITSPLANNYYARIYDPAYQPATPSINPQVNKQGLSRFFAALNRYRNGGAAPVVVFIGDSLTQGGHRAFDNWFWVQQFKQKLNEAYGIQMDYKNRGIAGRAAGDVANAVGLSDVHAPFESNWVTDSSSTWLSYIAALNPDLVVVAFGMNSGNANDSVDIVNLRNSLKALPSIPSLVWVTTPIRTTDLNASYGGSRFGTYPGNQYSNNNAYMTRLIADMYGDPVIDVNRMSNIVQLGFDPYDYAIDRWAGLYVDNSKKFTGSTPVVVNADGTLDLPVGGGNEIITNELFREVFVEFDIAIGANVNPLRIEMRQDPNSTSGVVLLFKPTSVELYYTIFTGGNFGLQQTYSTSPTAGNRYRIELVGKSLRLYVINAGGFALLGEVNNIMGSTFLAPVRFVGQSTTDATLKHVVIYGASRDRYKQYVPRLTAAEVFRVWYGGGGNNLNHHNTLGELEIYSQPINEFVSTLKSVDPEGSYISGSLTLNAGITSGLATYKVIDGRYVTITFFDLQVTSTLGANNLLTAVPAAIMPSETVYGTLWPLYGSTVVGFDIRPNGNSYLGGDLSPGATYKGTISYVI